MGTWNFNWKKIIAVVFWSVFFWLIMHYWDEIKHFIGETFS
jgi:hypothetical protein